MPPFPVFETYPPGAYIGPRHVEDFVDERIEDGLVHTIHVSERRAFRSCRERWNWSYAEDLHSIESIRALEFGSAYHRAMEVYYDPKTWHLDKTALAEHAIAEYKRYTIDTYDRFVRQGVADDRLTEDFKDRLVRGEQMLRHYFYALSPITDTFEPVEVEIAFEVPLLTPDGEYILCKCDRCWDRYEDAMRNESRGDKRWVGPSASDSRFRATQWAGLPVTIGGRLDVLFRVAGTNKLGVLDWKTAGNLMKDEELEFLQLDDQISTYLLAMQKLGLNADEFWYHEQWKASPEPPEPYAGNRTIKGRKYQANKQLATTYDLYKETVEEGDPAGYAAGAYDEFLEWLHTEGPQFYQRAVVRRNGAHLRATERAIYLEYLDMISGRVYPNPSRKQCTWCNFYDACLGKQRGERYQHILDSMFVKGGRELSNDSNLPKRDPGKEAERIDQETKDAGAQPRKDAETRREEDYK